MGCGTGALGAAVLEHCAPSFVVGIEPSQGFLDVARQNLAGRALLFQGDAASIPLDDGAVNVVVSGLVLNFIDDQRKALDEMKRIATGGGTIAAYVWDYAGKMELMRKFWEAAVSLRPGRCGQGRRQALRVVQAEALASLFADAGLAAVETTTIDIATPFASFDDYWEPFLGGQGPAPAYAMSLSEADRGALRERIRERLRFRANGSFSLAARAFAVRGTVENDAAARQCARTRSCARAPRRRAPWCSRARVREHLRRGPYSTIRPRGITAMRSHTCAATRRSWVMNSIARSRRCADLVEQREHLRLHRDVERGHRLVGDQELGLHRQRARDADALALAAGELVRIAIERVGVEPHELHQLARARHRVARATRRSSSGLR